MATPKPGSGGRYKYDGNDKAVKDSVDAANKRLADSDAKLLRGVQALNSAYQRGAGLIRGYVMAGIAGTTMGEAMSRNFQFLNREIANLFLPAITKVNEVLQKTVQWFRGLSGAQQEAIGKWSLIGVGALGFLTLLPKVTAAMNTFKASLFALSYTNPFILAITGMGALLASTDEGRQTLASLGQTLMAAFTPIANLIVSILVPAVEMLADFLNTALGKVVFFGTVAVALIPKLLAGMYSLIVAMHAALGPAGLLLAFIGLITAAFVGMGKAREKALTKDLEKDVAKGRKTPEEAKREAFERIDEDIDRRKQEREDNTGWGFDRFWDDLSNLFVSGNAAERAEKDRIRLKEEAAKRIDKTPRNELVQARGGKEDITATIQRLQDAVSKTDYAKQTADATRAGSEGIGRLEQLLRELQDRLPREWRPVPPVGR